MVAVNSETGVPGNKPPTCYRSLINFINCYIEYTLPWTHIEQAGSAILPEHTRSLRILVGFVLLDS